ncbi:sigma-70 family RNA polymerase sigma factor [Lachnospiraceae bacterium 50-23]|nr:sigma-70 family RNA polymerase sigma factor [Dorea sp.]GFI36436.1 ECF RNA polymerase sigma factor SigW [Lachnospiraceae bacterium]
MRVKSIGKTAFDAIYEANVDCVFRTALYYSGNHHAAEEITQNVFVKLYINMDNVNMNAVNTWLLTTAKHMALNHNRDNERITLIEEVIFKDEPGESLEDSFIRKLREKEHRELAESIFSELYRFNERWYDAVMITYFLEKPQKEVAEVMGVSVEVLHSMLYRAKRWIRKNYEEKYQHMDKA